MHFQNGAVCPSDSSVLFSQCFFRSRWRRGRGVGAWGRSLPRSYPRFKNEKSAQRGSFWDGYPADIQGSFARTSRPKTSVRVLGILEKTCIWARTSTTQRHGRPRPQWISKNFGQKNFGLDFRSLEMLSEGGGGSGWGIGSVCVCACGVCV